MTGVAALRMYDLDEVRAPCEQLWSAVASRLDDAPRELTWTGAPGVEWSDPDLVLGQTCGWPLVTDLRDAVTVVGAFDYDIAGADGRPQYGSVLVASEARPLDAFRNTVAAVNGTDSLSGWVSLGVAVADAARPAPFFSRLVETGSHRASVEAVRSGDAALASIDAVSWALLERHVPSLTRGLVVVGNGPTVPTLPLITAAPDPEPLRDALDAALADPATADSRAVLLINGFHRLDLSSYEALVRLGPVASETLGCRAHG
ncbi:MAG: PhnD/SsuA/transferrin family substrate-binding protein [Ilumatobacter sp.]|nr:PhnD/SsuA/transferrin family substrate-binding protein [Ilumatobacter sp.]